MSIRKFIESAKPLNQPLEKRVPSATLKKIDRDLREVAKAELAGTNVPLKTLARYLTDTYGLQISTTAAKRRLDFHRSKLAS